VPVRFRLAIWNAVVLAGAIFLLSALTYALEERSLAEEIDVSLENQANNLAGVYQVRAALPPRARERIIPQPSVFSGPSFHIQIIDPYGDVVERSAALGARRLPISQAALDRAGNGEKVFETIRLEGQDVRVFTRAVITNDEFLGFMQVARSLESQQDALGFLRRTLFIAGACLLVLAIGVAWLLAGLSLRPIERVTRAAREVGLSGRLDRRLAPVHSRDEIARLVDTFNHMMSRLEGAFTAQRRFVADASHELRTPLTTIRGNLELLRRTGAVQEPEMAEALGDVIGEAERMSRLVNGLLALARADAGQQLRLAPVRLDELVTSVYREAQALSREVSVDLGTLVQVEVLGDADALKQLLLILVDNGIKYTPAGGTVTLEVRREEDKVAAVVRDTGQGISPEDLPHIFERFYRSPSARASGGTGLGLAIAHWIVDEHRGRIAVESTPNVGTTFSVYFPTVPAATRPVAAAEESSAPAPGLVPASPR
jgi:two-component system, OmpR family, sensor kinase